MFIAPPCLKKKKLLARMQPHSSISCSQNLATGLYREPAESSPHLRNLFLHHRLSPIVRCTPKYQTVCLENFCDHNFVCITNWPSNPTLMTHTAAISASLISARSTHQVSHCVTFSVSSKLLVLCTLTLFLTLFFFIILNPRSFHCVTRLLHWRPTFSD